MAENRGGKPFATLNSGEDFYSLVLYIPGLYLLIFCYILHIYDCVGTRGFTQRYNGEGRRGLEEKQR